MSQEYPELKDVEIEEHYPFAGPKERQPFVLISFHALLRTMQQWGKVEAKDAYGLLKAIYEHALEAGRSKQEAVAAWAGEIKRHSTTRKVPIEMYVGLVEPQQWYTIEVEIPADTPQDKIEEVATAELLKILGKGDVYAAFYGVYHIPSAEECECDGYWAFAAGDGGTDG